MSTIKHIATSFQPHPEHNLTKNLQADEIQCLINILGNDRLALTTAVVQILFGLNGRWEKQVFDLKARCVIYEYVVLGKTRLEKCTDIFYTFDGATCKVGINFVDRDEAQAFFHHFQSKQEVRQARREQRTKTECTLTNNLANATCEAKSPKISHDDKKSGGLKKFFTKGRKTKIDISAPFFETFDHRNGISMNKCFFKDEEHRKIFEAVVGEMKISSEEATYLRENIANDSGDFETFMKQKQRKGANAHRADENRDPSLKTLPTVSRPATTGSNSNQQRPFQDIAIPISTHFQTSIASCEKTESFVSHPIPPRIHQHTVTPIRPPGPIPVAPPLPPPGPIPVAPPLPPPGPIPVAPPLPPPELAKPSNPSSSSSSTATDGRPAWLVDIENRGQKDLKKAPARPQSPVAVENTKKTMEEYIMLLLDKRREAIMGKKRDEDEEEESDGFDEDSD